MAEAVTLDDFIRTLQGIAQRESVMCEEALKKAAEVVCQECKDLIGTEDESWPPLAASTVLEKESLGYVGRVSDTDPLLRTGQFQRSWQVGPVDASRAVVGSDDPLAPYFEHGTSRMPSRPVLGVALFRRKPEIEAALGEAAVRLLRGAV